MCVCVCVRVYIYTHEKVNKMLYIFISIFSIFNVDLIQSCAVNSHY